MQTPTIVTIIVPVHNGERYLAEALDSMLSQTVPDFRVIVVDDESRDGSAAIALRYCDRDTRFTYLKSERNVGAGGARNIGISHATTDLVAFLDADDRWYPTFLERMIAVMQARPDIDCLFSDFDYIDETGAVSETHSAYDDPTQELHPKAVTYNEIWSGTNSPLPSVLLMKRSALLAVKMFRPIHAEDTNLWLRLGLEHSFWELPVVLASYRRHSSQWTSKANVDKFALGRTNAYWSAVRECPQIVRRVGRAEFRRRMHELHKFSGNYWFWMHRDYRRALPHLLQCAKHRPFKFDVYKKLVWCCTPNPARVMLRQLRKLRWSSP
jgi:glycosyltransferase involved in cell wall biosynthesis